MAYEGLKKKFPEEGSRCLKNCGKCCVAGAVLEQSEADEICEWLVKNKDTESLTAQFHHFDDNPKQCPFLTPEKTCFIYQVRPVACVMFGHASDPPGMPKEWSQQCPEGVKFTQITFQQTLPESMIWYGRAMKAMGRMINFRTLSMVDGAGVEGKITPKPGSVFEKMMNAKACFRCSADVPKDGAFYLHGNELLCAACDAKEVPGGTSEGPVHGPRPSVRIPAGP
jgi:Fe-S-cluster containining protein